MGVGISFICHDCKKYYTLGYGSYRSWLWQGQYHRLELPTDFDSIEELIKIINQPKNINMINCYIEHKGHDWITYNQDFDHGEEYDKKVNAYEYINLDID